jgi:hypothetical protein
MASNIVAQMQVLISAQTKGLNTALSQSQSALKSFESAISTTNKALGAFGIGIGAAAVANIAGEIVEVTAQFEKFGAVLSNTLGSQSAAQKALDDIRVFAQETPFEVSEVTAAYVRWANQGLNPTIDKMGKLGDVASSLGAGFEQTAEAFKDLLVGQTKRIEEIGISAQQSNGKIQLSFKGTNLEIEKTVEGVAKALDVFSALQGVQGTSAQVSETLGGRISNLKDAYSNLLLTIGTGNGGALKESVNALIAITNAAAGLIKTLTSTETTAGRFANFLASSFLAPTKFLLSFLDNTEEANKKLEQNNEKLRAIQATADAAFDSGNIEAYIKALDGNIFKEEIIAEIRRRQAAEIAAVNAARQSEIVTLSSLKIKLDELNKQFETTDKTDKAKLSNIGRTILATQAQIEALERLRKKQEEVDNQKLSSFGKKQLEDATLGSGRTKEEIARLSQSTALTGADFSTDLGVKLPFEDPEQLNTVFNNLELYTKAVQEAGVTAVQSIDQQILANDLLTESERRKGEMAQAVGQIFGDTVGDVLSGQQTLLQGLKSATAKLLPILLAQALAGTIAGAGKTTAPPPVIVALAAAGVAAVSALFAKATGHSGGGAGAGGVGSSNLTNVSRVPVATQSTQPQRVDFVLYGNDLVASQTSDMNAKLRLGR